MKIGGLQVDTQEVQGPFCKVAGIKEFPDLIYNGKFRGPSPRCGGPRAAPVHGGPRTGPRRRLAREWSERRPRAWNLAAVEEKGGGNGGEPHQLQEGAAEGRKRLGICGENRRRKLSVRAVLGHGEKRRELGALPFIPAGEGHAGVRRGETAGGNGLNAIDGWWLNEGLRGG
jgi:hypothetical protein